MLLKLAVYVVLNIELMFRDKRDLTYCHTLQGRIQDFFPGGQVAHSAKWPLSVRGGGGVILNMRYSRSDSENT